MEKIKMEAIPINQSEREKMEGRLEFKVCPFTAIELVPRLSGYMSSSAFYVHFICAVDGGKARGGHNEGLPRLGNTKITPCPLDYAKTCQLYQNQISEYQNLISESREK